jgi:hypothetical protein
MFPGAHSLFLPVLAQVGLTFVIYVALAVAKKRAARAHAVDRERAALHADAWPESVLKINNNLRNQFETPVLFYVVCFVLVAVGATGWLVQALAWLFVASRAIHAWIHTRSNIVPARRRVFMAGVLIVMLLWVIALLRVL